VDATATAVAEALSGANFGSVARDDIMRWKYRKLLLNLGNAVEAVCGGEARRGPLYGRVMRRAPRSWPLPASTRCPVTRTGSAAVSSSA
jgi:hypothetical protein